MNLKTIIREEINDFDWIKDVKPPILQLIDVATVNHDNIYVNWDNGYLDDIEDANGHDYFNEDDLGLFLGCDYEDWDNCVKNITKEKLLLFLKNRIEEAWVFDYCEGGRKNVMGGGIQDCFDYMELYRLIEKL